MEALRKQIVYLQIIPFQIQLQWYTKYKKTLNNYIIIYHSNYVFTILLFTIYYYLLFFTF